MLFSSEELHYKHVNGALDMYTSEYVEAADTTSINRTDLDKSSLEANKFLRTIKQITTDSGRGTSARLFLFSFFF